LLEAKVMRKTSSGLDTVYRSVAMNEALITLSHPGRLLEMWLGENHDAALVYKADGLIVSTATGSTGHSLSAGGPILEPHLAALIITPISPHSLFNRPLVFGGEKELHIWFPPDINHEMVLILDGQIQTVVHATDEIRIQRSKHTISTIMLPNRTFSQVLRNKFNLGELT
jgi:NAD+ kinase